MHTYADSKRSSIRVLAKAAVGLLLGVGSVGLGASLAGASTRAHHAKHTTVVLNGHICTKVATAKHPKVTGHAGQTVCGLSGNDTLQAAGPGIVTLVAGPGHHNTLRASRSHGARDVLISSGVPGGDTFVTGAGDDTVDTAPNDTITCSSSGSTTIAGDSSGDQEDGCQSGNSQDASQEWQGVVTTTDGSTTMTVQPSDWNDAAQAWLDANGDPTTVTFDISSAQIDMGDGGSVANGDQVEVAANPSDPTTLAGSTLVAVSVDGQGSDSQSTSDGGGDGGDGGGGGGGGYVSPCPSGTLSGTVTGDVLLLGVSCTLDNATVQGDVIAGPGASLTVQNGSTVDGDLAAFGADSVSVTGSTVRGDVKIAGATGAVTVTSDTISGDVGLFANLGGVTVGSDQIGGGLECDSNAPAPTNNGGNTVSGGSDGQCAGF